VPEVLSSGVAVQLLRLLMESFGVGFQLLEMVLLGPWCWNR
jgi:hypothetical protein